MNVRPMKLSKAVFVFPLLFLAVAAGALGANSTKYSIEEQNVQQQTGNSSVVGGYGVLGYNQYSIVAKVDTGGASLSSAPVLGLPAPTSAFPSGSITFPTGTASSPNWPAAGGYNRYQYGNAWPTQAELNANIGSGTFTFTLGNATATPTLSLDLVNPVLPPTPMITSGGTWSGSSLLVDPTVDVTLNLNSVVFTSYTTGAGAAISVNLFPASGYPVPLSQQALSQYGLGKTDPALGAFVISAGTLTAGQDYILQVNYSQLVETNTTSFTGTGISGSPLGLSYETSTTFINIVAVPEPGTAVGLALASLVLLAFAFAKSQRSRIKA